LTERKTEIKNLIDCKITLGGYVEQTSHDIKFNYNFEIELPSKCNLSWLARKVLKDLHQNLHARDSIAAEKNCAFLYSPSYMSCIYHHKVYLNDICLK